MPERGGNAQREFFCPGVRPNKKRAGEYELLFVVDLERGHPSTRPHPDSLEMEGESGKTSFHPRRFSQPEDKLTNPGWLGELEVNCSLSTRYFDLINTCWLPACGNGAAFWRGALYDLFDFGWMLKDTDSQQWAPKLIITCSKAEYSNNCDPGATVSTVQLFQCSPATLGGRS